MRFIAQPDKLMTARNSWMDSSAIALFFVQRGPTERREHGPMANIRYLGSLGVESMLHFSLNVLVSKTCPWVSFQRRTEEKKIAFKSVALSTLAGRMSLLELKIHGSGGLYRKSLFSSSPPGYVRILRGFGAFSGEQWTRLRI